MKVAVVGGRDFKDYDFIKNTFLEHFENENVTHIVSGGARGVDTFAEELADELGIEKMVFEADWDSNRYGAGFKRNNFIVENADIILAFWDGISTGTRDTIQKSRRAGKKRIIIGI